VTEGPRTMISKGGGTRNPKGVLTDTKKLKKGQTERGNGNVKKKKTEKLRSQE